VSGIGNFTKELNKIADDIAEAGKQFGLKTKTLKAKNELDIQTLKEVSKTVLRNNETSKLSTIKNVQNIDRRLSKLTDILRQRKDVDAIKKSLAQKAVMGAVGTGAGLLINKINK
jgi:DNA-binding ferritin-like protein